MAGAMRSFRVVGSRVRDSEVTVDTPPPIGSPLRGGEHVGVGMGAWPLRVRAHGRW